MKKLEFFKKIMIGALILLLAVPAPLFAQGNQADTRKFSQEQLDQMLAPIALYPDALLAQVLMASTYPLEVVLADRWVRENQDLKGDQLNNALDRESWDVSVKALVPFPSVLAMMSENMEWTQMVGDAFLVQEENVMSTVQQLRQRAYDAGNLTNTEQQLVTRENDVIKIEPRNSTVVYVPVYDPWWVFGTWWWPAYPPYVVYPYRAGVVIAPGFIWFGTGFFVGAFWKSAWGHWDWHHHHIYINVDRRININRPVIKTRNVKTKIWVHDPVHRRRVAYPNRYTRERFGKRNQNEVKNRLLYRGFNRGPGGDVDKAKARTVRSGSLPDRQSPLKVPIVKSNSLPDKQVPRKVPVIRSGRLPDKQAQHKASAVKSGNLPDRQAARKAPAVRSGSLPGKQVSRKVSTVKSGSLPGKQTSREAPDVRSGSLSDKWDSREVPTVKSSSRQGRGTVRSERGRDNAPGRFDASNGVGFRRGR